MEKKEIKISLGTVICICIIVILLAVIGIMYFKMKNIDSKNTAIKQEETKQQESMNDNDIKINETSTIKDKIEEEDTLTKQEEIKEQEKEIINDNDTKINETSTIKDKIKEYILTEFGPKGNMEDVTINEVNTKNEDNSNLIYGSCIYSITLKDPNKLTMEGSKSSVDKLEGNVYTLDADFTYDKKTNKVKFDTSYGFGN